MNYLIRKYNQLKHAYMYLYTFTRFNNLFKYLVNNKNKTYHRINYLEVIDLVTESYIYLRSIGVDKYEALDIIAKANLSLVYKLTDEEKRNFSI